MLSHEGRILKVAETLYSSGESPKFALSLQHQNAAYLRLDVLSRDQSERISYCFAEINNLSVSESK
jgi:hypothetical protein